MCRLFCVLMVLLCGGVWRDVFCFCVWRDVFCFFSHRFKYKMRIFRYYQTCQSRNMESISFGGNMESISFDQILGLRGSCEACGGDVGGWEGSHVVCG